MIAFAFDKSSIPIVAHWQSLIRHGSVDADTRVPSFSRHRRQSIERHRAGGGCPGPRSRGDGFRRRDGALADTIRRWDCPSSSARGRVVGRRFASSRALAAICREQRIDVVARIRVAALPRVVLRTALTAGAAAGGTIMSMAVAPFIPRSLPLIVGTREIAEAARRTRGGQVDVIEPRLTPTAIIPAFPAQEFRVAHGSVTNSSIVVVSRLALEFKLEGLQRAIRARRYWPPNDRFVS